MSQNNNSMEDILTSIRTSVEEETAKATGGEQAVGDDVLALSEEDITGDAAGGADDELIDIDAFANSGEAKAASKVDTASDPLGVNAPAVAAPPPEAKAAEPAAPAAPAAGGPDEVKAAEDDFDRLLAELETPAGEAPAAPAPEAAPEAPAVEEVVAEVPVDPAPAPAPAAAAPAAVAAPAVAAPSGRLELAAIETVDGLQVAFPAEVLAAALRPLVKDWVAENMPGVVERLVKEEIAKISQE